MITRKELSYINSWANRVPYPGREYCEIAMDKLKECFELFGSTYANKKFVITFSNLDEIELQVKHKNISHMLGVDFKNLSGDCFKSFRNDILSVDPEIQITSYELLKNIVENSSKVLDYDETNRLKSLNYYKISIKADIFKKLADLSQFNFGCINFNKEKFLQLNPEINFSSNSTKFLYTDSDESISPYFLMGLKKDDYTDKNIELDKKEEISIDEEEYEKKSNYIVETLIAPINIESFFNSQEVVIPTQILVDINGKLDKKIASPTEKIKLLKEYRSIINQYKLSNNIDIYGDYMSYLMEQQRQKEKIIK